MALGQAAGTAAALSINSDVSPRKIDIVKLQHQLLQDRAVLVYFQDAKPEDHYFKALQFCALQGVMGEVPQKAQLNQPVSKEIAQQWIENAQLKHLKFTVEADTTRGELLSQIYGAKFDGN